MKAYKVDVYEVIYDEPYTDSYYLFSVTVYAINEDIAIDRVRTMVGKVSYRYCISV